jgi:hypothetical protein
MVLCGANKAGWGMLITAVVWASCMTGPFAGLWAASTWRPVDAIGWAAACVVAIAAHPLLQGRLSGSISVAGVGLWMLLGFGLTFDGV